MTHFLRSKHDAILIGVGTAIADDPSLNCRIEGVGGYGGEGLDGQPRPVIIDPHGRWDIKPQTKCIRLASEGRGRGPLLITCGSLSPENNLLLQTVDGKALIMEGLLEDSNTTRISWDKILSGLAKEGIRSVMIEGGGAVINNLLSPDNFKLVDTVIVTVAPTWLGKGGVQVCPEARSEEGVRVPVARLRDVKWVPLGEDVVLCGRPIV
jgi:2,5-diamino-6-(ribosylamino)-4(3H)-pyrimidinone 5'-phosphate reductase